MTELEYPSITESIFKKAYELQTVKLPEPKSLAKARQFLYQAFLDRKIPWEFTRQDLIRFFKDTDLPEDIRALMDFTPRPDRGKSVGESRVDKLLSQFRSMGIITGEKRPHKRAWTYKFNRNAPPPPPVHFVNSARKGQVSVSRVIAESLQRLDYAFTEMIKHVSRLEGKVRQFETVLRRMDERLKKIELALAPGPATKVVRAMGGNTK